MVVLPTTYLGPTEWYRKLLLADPYSGKAGAEGGEQVVVEVMESFLKHTYRNRCTIMTPDGPLTLSVPVKKVGSKQYTRDVEISYQTKWQHQHWMAIMSAYKHTPYFDYYQEFIRPFYERETRFLIDLNDGLHEVIMSLLDNRPPKTGQQDYLLPKTTDWSGLSLEDNWGDGMSILDMLFNYGPYPPAPFPKGKGRNK